MIKIVESKEFAKGLIQSFWQSYAQVFFSENRVLAFILITVSFFNIDAGVGGALSTIVTNAVALAVGLNSEYVKKGVFGYNSLLVGLGIGLSFQLTVISLILILFASLLTLLFTIFFQGVLG